MAKSKERLDAEATYQMNWRQRVENAWFYYKWWLFGGALLLGLLLLFLHDLRANVEPDYSIGMLSPYYLSDQLVTELENAVLPYADDRNGDGKLVVTVLAYNMAVGEEAPADPMGHAAAMTRLSGDIQMGQSMLFLTNAPADYQEVLEVFCYNDGEVPSPQEAPDLTRLGVPLADCPAFAGVDTSSAGPNPFVLVKRSMEGSKLLEKEESAAYYADSMELFQALTAK